MAQVEVLTPDDLAAMDALIAPRFASLEASLVLDSGPLTPSIMAEGVDASILPGQEKIVGIEQLRYRHHRIAQLLAVGLKPVTIARQTGFSPGYIANLQRSPAFIELMAHYAAEVEDQFTDFVAKAADLSQEMVDELGRRLADAPAQFSVNQILESIKTLADRSGNAPIARSVSTNVNLDLGTKLAEARRRATDALLPRPD